VWGGSSVMTTTTTLIRILIGQRGGVSICHQYGQSPTVFLVGTTAATKRGAQPIITITIRVKGLTLKVVSCSL